MSYEYVPNHAQWAKLSRDERIAVAERYVADADKNRSVEAAPGPTMAQRQAAEVMRLALATPVDA